VPDQLPTHEQIGYLYLFAHYSQMQAEQLRNRADEILEALPWLYSITEDTAAKAAAEGREDA
jgi:hypothetical protein